MSTEEHRVPFKWEVGISYQTKDQELVDRITERVRPDCADIFVYSEQQHILAGESGVEIFARTFRSDCRVAVIIFSAGWGKEGMTLVEGNAIKDRIQKGHEFLVVIKADEEPLPDWLRLRIGTDKIWVDVRKAGGVDVAAFAILDRVRRLGGTKRKETAMEMAARRQSERDRAAKIEAFAASTTGKKSLLDEMDLLMSMLREQAAEIHESTDYGLFELSLRAEYSFGVHTVVNKCYVVGRPAENQVVVDWWDRDVERVPEWQAIWREAYEAILLDVDPPQWNWKRSKTLTTEELANQILTSLLKLIDQSGVLFTQSGRGLRKSR